MSAGYSTELLLRTASIRTGEPGFHNTTTLESFLLAAIADLNIYAMPTWSYKTLEITPFNTVEWPCDCIKPIITVLKRTIPGNTNPCYFLMEVSEEIMEVLFPNPVAPAGTTPVTANDLFQIDGFLEAYGWSIWNWGLGELYGANTLAPPYGNVIHQQNKRQSFIKNVALQTGDQIVMFFKSTGLEVCPEFVPAEAKEVLEYHILMKWFEIKNPNLADDMERKYKERLFRMQRFNQEGDEASWVRSMYASVKSSPKY